MRDHRLVLTGTPEALVEDYRHWLVVERSLAPTTISYYVSAARLFLVEVDGQELKSLTVGDVTGFMVRQCPRFSVGTAKKLAAGLRSFLSYLFVEGITDRQLGLAVPAPSGPHGGNLPRWLGAAELRALLAEGSYDETAVGRRDRAVVVMLARLGLRAGEVAALRLDDLDWRAGEIVVTGKGDRTERLPLPVDVGEALVAYLRGGRPTVSCRSLFLRAQRPMTGLSATGVGGVVHRACVRAGVSAVGAHRLRHSAATAMLRAGASLDEVGQVLRHRSSQVTALYAKVDFEVLQERADEGCVKVGHVEFVGLAAGALGGEAQQQPPGVAVGRDGVRAGVALVHQPLGEERFETGGEFAHGRRSSACSSRSAARNNNSGTADRYQNVFSGFECPSQVDNNGICASTLTPARYHPINVRTAKLCLRSCGRGRRPEPWSRPTLWTRPAKTVLTLRLSLVPVVDKKKLGALGCGHHLSRTWA